MDEDEITFYCICRTPDIDRFMIMCDQCEEWYHGDCIDITERESRRIKYFYCKWCRSKNSSLKIQYRKSKKDKSRRKEEKTVKTQKKKIKSEKHDHNKQNQLGKKRKISENTDLTKKTDNVDTSWLGNQDISANKTETYQGSERFNMPTISNIFQPDGDGPERRQDCGKCENCVKKSNDDECHKCRETGVDCLAHQCITKAQVRQYTERSDYMSQRMSMEKRGSIKFKEENLDISNILSQNKFKPTIKQKNHDGQCYGPNCIHAARAKSKYCSDECGKRLAAKRLLHIMPARVNEWSSTLTVANEVGSQDLERIRSAMVQARLELQALEDKFKRLESIITRSKAFSIREGFSDTEETDESDHTIFCVVCGHPVSLRVAIKHMDRCYIKIESQISFGSVYPTRIEGSERLFCDVYNHQQQTYCKRLQVICPEHSKEPKISANEVCGCPLTNDIFEGSEPTSANDFCSRAKRKCNKHYKWEFMYRASVDLQRIRQWLKIDEIFEEERRIRNSMVSRAGVIPLLLHQTTAHDPVCLDMRTKPSNVKRPAYRLVI